MISALWKRGGTYYAKLQLDGWAHPQRPSLRTTDKRVALARLEALTQQAEREAEGIAAPRSVREAAKQPLSELLQQFLADLTARSKSANTVRIYEWAVRRVSTDAGWTVLRDVTAAAFTDWRSETSLSPKSRNDCLSAFSRFFRWLRRRRLVLENPFELVEPVDTRATDREHRRALTAAEVERLLAAAPRTRRIVYRMALETGLRRAELNGLRWGDFFFCSSLENGGASTGQDGASLAPQRSQPGAQREGSPPSGAGEGAWGSGPCVRVPASISKNRKSALLPLSVGLAGQIHELRGEAASFAFAFKGHVPTIETLRRDLARAGIAYVDEMGRKVDLHALRKTFGTALVLAGESPRVVMEAMRHSDLKLTLKVYTDAGKLPMREAVNRLPWATERSAAS